MNRTTTSPFDIKSASIQGLSLILRSANLGVIEADLAARVASAGDLFTNAPVLINVAALTADDTADKLELTRLINLLRRHTMRAVGIVGATGLLLKQAQALGLMEEVEVQPRTRRQAPEPERAQEQAEEQAKGQGQVQVAQERQSQSESASVPSPSAAGQMDEGEQSSVVMTAGLFADTAVTAPPDMASPARSSAEGQVAPTKVIDRPLRSGQRVYARGGDLVVLGLVSHGAEVIADGNIHIYGPLRGRAIAGANGDTDARIFAAAMEPELISIAGTYRTTDKPLADDVLGKPAQVRLDGDRMLIEPLRN